MELKPHHPLQKVDGESNSKKQVEWLFSLMQKEKENRIGGTFINPIHTSIHPPLTPLIGDRQTTRSEQATRLIHDKTKPTQTWNRNFQRDATVHDFPSLAFLSFHSVNC